LGIATAAATLAGMNHFTCFGAVCALGLFAVAFALGAADAPEKTASKEAGKGQLFHVVSLKFKPAATQEQIGLVEKSFAALKENIPGIKSLNWGTNVSPEKHDKGFTHCFVLTFATEKDRDAYLVHEDHKAFGQVLRPAMDDVMVIDFWAKQ
jgi:hypothetical protein